MEGYTADVPDGPDAPQQTLADKIDLLFKTVYPEGGKPYTYAEAAAGIEKVTGGSTTMTANGLWKLRGGRTLNPSKSTIEGLAAFFGVPASFFFDDSPSAAQISEQLTMLAALRDTHVQLRSFADLSPDSQQMVAELIERTARLEQNARRRPDADSGHDE